MDSIRPSGSVACEYLAGISLPRIGNAAHVLDIRVAEVFQCGQRESGANAAAAEQLDRRVLV